MQSQYAVVPGERTGDATVERLTHQLMALDSELDEIEQTITERFRGHAYAPAIESMPGFGPLLDAEFVAAINGDLANNESPDRLAGIAGLAPVPHDSGPISGNRNAHGDTTGACSGRATWPPTNRTQGAARSPKVSPIAAVGRARGSEGRSECRGRPAVTGRVFCSQTVGGRFNSSANPLLSPNFPGRTSSCRGSGFGAGSAGNVAENGFGEATVDTDVLPGDVTR